MKFITNWFQRASPVVKGLMFISLASGFTVVYRLYVRPYQKRQRLLEAESYAQILMQADQDNSHEE